MYACLWLGVFPMRMFATCILQEVHTCSRSKFRYDMPTFVWSSSIYILQNDPSWGFTTLTALARSGLSGEWWVPELDPFVWSLLLPLMQQLDCSRVLGACSLHGPAVHMVEFFGTFLILLNYRQPLSCQEGREGRREGLCSVQGPGTLNLSIHLDLLVLAGFL